MGYCEKIMVHMNMLLILNGYLVLGILIRRRYLIYRVFLEQRSVLWGMIMCIIVRKERFI